MYVYHEDKLYKLSVYIRESVFELLRESNPNFLMSIKSIETKKEKFVKITELLNYSVVRNRLALKV